MLRWGLLGGVRPPLPWEFFVTVGGAIVSVCPLLFGLLYPWWTTFPVLGLVELGVFGTVGATLLAIGANRRKVERRPPPATTAPVPRRW